MSALLPPTKDTVAPVSEAEDLSADDSFADKGASYVTDAVYYTLPSEMGFDAATAMFTYFGEVADVQMVPVPGDEITVKVAFFDTHAAAHALSSGLGCLPAPAQGDRQVLLPSSSIQQFISVDSLASFSHVSGNPTGPISADFCDIRDAARFHQSHESPRNVDETSSSQAFHEIQTFQTYDEVPISAPWVDTLSWTQLGPGLCSWPMLADPPGEWQTDSAGADTVDSQVFVLVGGLPNNLLQHSRFEVVLQQAFLTSEVSAFLTNKGKPSGEALLKVDCQSAAEHCLRHFRACCWGWQKVGITAKILREDDADISRFDLGALAPIGASATSPPTSTPRCVCTTPPPEPVAMEKKSISERRKPGTPLLRPKSARTSWEDLDDATETLWPFFEVDQVACAADASSELTSGDSVDLFPSVGISSTMSTVSDQGATVDRDDDLISTSSEGETNADADIAQLFSNGKRKDQVAFLPVGAEPARPSHPFNHFNKFGLAAFVLGRRSTLSS